MDVTCNTDSSHNTDSKGAKLGLALLCRRKHQQAAQQSSGWLLATAAASHHNALSIGSCAALGEASVPEFLST
jgi:hypothetical protein